MQHLKKTIALLKRLQFCLALGLAPLLCSCASTKPPPPPPPSEAYLQRVIQYPADSDGTNLKTRGFLLAYTPVEIHFDDNGRRFYRHSGYYICPGKCDDKFCNYIPNHLSTTDEAATVVNLPAGAYWIKTQTAYGQPFFVYIVIRPSVITTINLEEDRRPPVPLTGELYRICLDGKKIGWVADTPANLPVKQVVVTFPWPGI